MSEQLHHERWMQRALRLAERGLFTTSPNPRVGCTLVKNGVEVGAGWHLGAGQPHAEVYALREAGAAAKGATAYINLEPCSHFGRTPPCADALLAAKVQRVVIGHIDPNPKVAGQGIARLQAAGVEVVTDVLTQSCHALNIGFFKRMDTGLPWVRLKIAQSLDGRTAMSSGESQWITSAPARADVQLWRARSCVVLSTAQTVLQDDARLKVRESLLAQRWPEHPPLGRQWRAVLDQKLRIAPDHPFYTENPDSALLITSDHHDADTLATYRALGVTVLTLPVTPEGFVMKSVLQALGGLECNEVLVEAGPTLAAAMVSAGCVDEVILYVAPSWLGSTGMPVVALPFKRLQDTVSLNIIEQRQIGPDWRIIATIDESVTQPIGEPRGAEFN